MNANRKRQCCKFLLAFTENVNKNVIGCKQTDYDQSFLHQEMRHKLRNTKFDDGTIF